MLAASSAGLQILHQTKQITAWEKMRMHEVLAIKRISNAINYGEGPESVRPTPTNILPTISLINSDVDI